MQTRIKNHYGLRRRGDGYGQKKCTSFGFHELDLLEYSERRAERNGRSWSGVSAEEEGLSWSGKIKKLLREDRDKKRELAEMRQSIYGASL